MKTITLATRGSALALAQARLVAERLKEADVSCEILCVKTKGDKDTKSPLQKIGGSGLFVKEIEKVLLQKQADIAVHSAKDLPYEESGETVLFAVTKAADCRDVLIMKKGEKPYEGMRLGTSSARRAANAKKLFPRAEICDIRGNVETRLFKLSSGAYDAVLLAKAGLDRLGTDLSDFEVTIFEREVFLPACGQGIIAVQCRKNDEETVKLLSSLCEEETQKRLEAERYMLSLLRADCAKPIGISADLHGDEIEIAAMFENKTATARGSFCEYKAICEKIKEEIYG